MTAFSLGTVWEETIAFLRRERALLIPVALAIFGPAHLLLAFAMVGADPATMADKASPQTMLVFPALLLALLGYLAISLLVLVPGITVGDALRRAIRAFPRTIGTGVLMVAAWVAVALAVVVSATLGIMLFRSGVRAADLTDVFSFLVIVPMLVIVVRMLLYVPVLAIEDRKPVDAVRRIWALGQNNIVRFIGVWILFLFVNILVKTIDMLVFGSVFRLLALGIGDAELIGVVQALLSAGLQAMLSLGMTVYLAFIYRRLA